MIGTKVLILDYHIVTRCPWCNNC